MVTSKSKQTDFEAVCQMAGNVIICTCGIVVLGIGRRGFVNYMYSPTISVSIFCFSCCNYFSCRISFSIFSCLIVMNSDILRDEIHQKDNDE